MNNQSEVKKYKEALEKAKSLYEKTNLMVIKNIVTDFFPEIKELENEKVKDTIKSALKNYFTNNYSNGTNNVNYGICLSWVENHKSEDKAVNDDNLVITPIFKVGDVLKKKGKDYTFIVDRIEGGYYFCDHKNGASFPIEEQNTWEIVKENTSTIYLIQCIDNRCDESFASRAFFNTDDAKTYMVETLKRVFDKDYDDGLFSDGKIEEIWNDGYYADDNYLALEIKGIELK